MFVRQDTVVVRRGTPEHGGIRHQTFFVRLNDRKMTCAARFIGDAQIARVDEAHEF